MKIKNIIRNGVLCIILSPIIQASMIEYKEDGYVQQAPQEIITVAQKAAELVDFDKNYELVVPKQSCIEINPLNKFITYGVNPATKNFFILANPTWLAKMPEDQQVFFFARSFLVFKEGKTLLMKILPYLYTLLSFILIVLFFLLLGKTPLSKHKTWIRFLIALLVAGTCEPLFLDRLYTNLLQHLNYNYDVQIIKSVSEKIKDKESIIKALNFYDASIQEEAQNDIKFWAPYLGLFANYADKLKNN